MDKFDKAILKTYEINGSTLWDFICKNTSFDEMDMTYLFVEFLENQEVSENSWDESQMPTLNYPYREWLISVYEKESLKEDRLLYLNRYGYIFQDLKLKKPKWKLTNKGLEEIYRLKIISPSLRFK